MPYIKQEDRAKFAEAIKIGESADCAGDLNYLITEICHTYLRKKGVRYANFNEVIGMLECCKMELYRRQVALYEDQCIIKNGDTTTLSEPVARVYDVPTATFDEAGEGFYNRLKFSYNVADEYEVRNNVQA
jgi:hypothetical protein